MKPYYEDDAVMLYHGRAEDILPTIAPESVDVLLTDPPYFNVKDEDWDRQWKKRDEFLSWLGGIIDATLPSLLPSASAWVFASPALTSRVEAQVIEPRLRVLNSIRWVKEAGWHQKADIEAQRRYLTAWEGVIFAEQVEDVYAQRADDLHKSAMAPIGSYIQSERLRAGVGRREIARRLAANGIYRNEQTGAAMCSDWEYGDSMPTPEGYAALRDALGGGFLTREWDDLRAEWDTLTAQFYETRDRDLEPLRRPFRLTRSGPVTDVWNFAPVMGYVGKHPCEKPLAMLDHMLSVSSKPGAMILDPFAGSGSTLRAAKDLGRRAIGIELQEVWCEHAARRLSQDVLDFGGAA